MTEMTPEKLRGLAKYLRDSGLCHMAGDAAAASSAWEDACRRADGWQRQAEECAAGIVLAVIRQHDAESRIEELEKENKVLRANASKSVLRRLESQGAIAAEPKLKLVDLGGGLSSYENLGRNPPEERAAIDAEEET